MAVLRETGLDQNTVVMLTTDHGELLGEHGLWYKKSFFEEACRIPLIIASPQAEAGRVDANVSLVDLLPTLLQIAGDKQLDSLIEPLSGHGLWNLVNDASSEHPHPVYAENLAEGATIARLMVKHERLKYIYSAADPHQLFDLETDPHEQVNQIDNPDYAEAASRLLGMVQQRWNPESLTEEIRQSQQRRIFLRQVLGKEMGGEWEFRPDDELERHCLRADRIYSQWAYGGLVGFHVPEES